MSDNIRTALYDADYTVRLASRRSDARRRCCRRVVGKHCESGDIVVRDAGCPPTSQPGDLLAVAATGAYCRSMASNYNHAAAAAGGRRPRRARATEIVRRETPTTCSRSTPVLSR